MHLDTKSLRRILFLILILIVSLPADGDQELVRLIDQSCTQAGENLHKELKSPSWGNPPAACSSSFVRKTCQDELSEELTKAVNNELGQQMTILHQEVLSSLSRLRAPHVEIGYLYVGLDGIIKKLGSHWTGEVARHISLALSTASDSDLKSMPPPGLPLKAIDGFASDCRTTLIPGISMMLCDLADGGQAASTGVDCGAKKQSGNDDPNDNEHWADVTHQPPADERVEEDDDGTEEDDGDEDGDEGGDEVYISLTREEIVRIAAEQDYLAELNKESGFSRVVRCRWTGVIAPRLDCNPGLRVSGHDIAVIEILPPADKNFRLRWVQAIGTEELPGKRWPSGAAYTDKLHCPGYEGSKTSETSLTCDELCFEKDGPCASTPDRLIETQSAEVAVHTKRRFSATYGCPLGSMRCAQRRLRHDRSETQPAKLTLLTRGRSPVIRVRAMNQNDEIAEGAVLVGYQRWRIESGGFMGIAWKSLDHEIVTEAGEEDLTASTPTKALTDDAPGPGEVKILDIRESDDYAQETGIFVNFIPSNYEWFGVSLGFATADGKAPSVYLGPTVRLTTFGNRGIAALSAGVAMRQVDRFPDLKVGKVLDADSQLLEPDRHFDLGPYIGIQLGFSFGPISVSDSED